MLPMWGPASSATEVMPEKEAGPQTTHRRNTVAVSLTSALAGLLVGVFATTFGPSWSSVLDLSAGKTTQRVAQWSIPLRAIQGPNITFGPSKAEEVLGELTISEFKSAAQWFRTHLNGDAVREANKNSLWLAGPSGLELLFPKKAEVLSYLDGTGPKPPRFARLTTVGPSGIVEYSLGPIVDGAVAKNATLQRLDSGDVPYTKRPTEAEADGRLLTGLYNKTMQTLGPLLLEAFGPIFPMLDDFTGEHGMILNVMRNDALSRLGERIDMIKALWQPPAPQRPDAFFMHPLPIDIRFNTTDVDPSAWAVLSVRFCSQKMHSAEAMMAAYNQGQIRVCKPKLETGTWDVPVIETPRSEEPMIVESHGGVSWGPWTFTITGRPSQGPALVDVRFKGERILYELSIQEAHASYSGTRDNQFFYSDSSWSLSMLSTSLEPGVDCPEGAHYLKANTWYHMENGGGAVANVSSPFEFMPACVFEWDEDHTIWRHMENADPPHVRGLVRRTVVVRFVCTVGNYDYISDVKFREDGEIEVHTRFAGYLETRYFNADFNAHEANWSSIVRPNLAGPVHSHLIGWKADIDVAGSLANSLRKTSVGIMDLQDAGLVTKYIKKEYISNEGVGSSTFVANPREPGHWAIVDRNAVSAAGNPRGYAVNLNSMSAVQLYPDDHPFTIANPFTKYHLAVTKYHDDEYRANSPYLQYDGSSPVGNKQDLDRFLSNKEDIMDQDLVAWICVGKEHVPRQEDLPLVSNFGAGFSLMPWNFFETNEAASPR